MNNLNISTDPTLLNVDSRPSLNLSPSISTFLPDEEASMYPLLPLTPTPPHCDNAQEMRGDDAGAETSSSSGSSGIGMDVPIAGTTTLFNQNVYQHLGKNSDIMQENGTAIHANLNIPLDKDTPSFVHWNWPLIRKCTFFFFLASVFAMLAIVISMIAALPKICNPKNSWYQGSIIYEIFPASFQDSTDDGLGDLRGLATRANYLRDLGVSAIRLNSIFPSKNYPHHFQNVTTLLEIDEVLGESNKEIAYVAESLHARNISLLLDLPIFPLIKQLYPIHVLPEITANSSVPVKVARSTEPVDDQITEAIRLWLSLGVDGFYIKGLENFHNDPYLLENLRKWKHMLGPERILIINKNLIDKLDVQKARSVLDTVDLIDVFLDIKAGSKSIDNQINDVLHGILSPQNGSYIQWSLGGISQRRITNDYQPNATLAAHLMALILPGTPTIFYGDEISLQEPFESENDTQDLRHLSPMAWNTGKKFTGKKSLPWLPDSEAVSFHHFDYISDMINLRKRSPSIYQNVIHRSDKLESNTVLKEVDGYPDIVIIERRYPRRNTFVAISNFGRQKLTMNLSTLFYKGEIMVGPHKGDKVYFREFHIDGLETIIVRLNK